MNDISISYALTAVPSRRDEVQRITSFLFDIPVDVLWDIEYKGVWWNVKRAWRTCPPEATHRVLMSDDLSFCADFAATTEVLVSLLPNEIISLYTPRKAALEVEEKRQHWITRNMMGGGCYLLPANIILKFLLWDEKYNKEFWNPKEPDKGSGGEDLRLSMFMRAHNLLSWHPVPSLVQHSSISSTVGNPPGRNSHVFKGTDICLAHLDWTTGIDTPTKWTKSMNPKSLEIYKGKVTYA